MTTQYAGTRPREMNTTTRVAVEGRRRGEKGPRRELVGVDVTRLTRAINELIGAPEDRTSPGLDDLAKNIGVTSRTLQRLMSGAVKSTDYYTLDAIATACCVHISHLEVAS